MTNYFNRNVYHLVAAHGVTEIMHEIALRTIAERHPIHFLI